MNEEIQTTIEGEQPEMEQPTETATLIAESTETDETTFNLNDVSRQYYSPEEMDVAGKKINEIIENVDARNVVFNFDPENPDTIADGFGLAIIPNTKRVDGQGTITYGITIAAMPDPSTVLGNEKGDEFVRDLVINALLAKVANSARVRADGNSGTLPVTITDFMERRASRGEGLKTYTAIAPPFVKALRKKGLKLINAPILRNVLQSAQFALETFEKIPQAQWEQVLKVMIAKADQEKLDPAILNDWLDKRDEFEIDTVDEVDFDDLADML